MTTPKETTMHQDLSDQMKSYLEVDSQIKALEKLKEALKESILKAAKAAGGVVDTPSHLAQVVVSYQERLVGKDLLIDKLGLDLIRKEGLIQEVTVTTLKVINKNPKS
jgi:hypothetical protein